MKCLKTMAGVSRLDRLRNEEVRERMGVRKELAARVDMNVLRWFGHVERMENERLLKIFAIGTMKEYRFTLQSVLRHTGWQIYVDPDISDVLRSLQLQTPHESRDLVPWNLDIVL